MGRLAVVLGYCNLHFRLFGNKLVSETNVETNFQNLCPQEEGIVVKAADSPWRCNDRGMAWLKIKADYVHKVEIDAVIIGAKFGTGRRGGAIAEYLLALAEVPQGGTTEPSTFVSFCV